MRASLWRDRDFVRFWFGETISLLGAQISALAIPLTAIDVLGATEGDVGLLRFAQLAPFLFLALVFGVWVDRVHRRPVMIGANLARLACLLALPLLHWAGLLTLPLLIATACLIGVAAVAFDVSWMSFVPSLVPEKNRFPEATARINASSSAADVAGPGAAGFLLSVVSAPTALLADAASYLVSIACLAGIRTQEPPVPPTRRRVGQELREGLAWVWANPILRWLAVVGFCVNLSMTAMWTMFLTFGAIDLDLSPGVLGLVFSAASCGGFVGALLAGPLTRRFAIGRLYVVFQTALLSAPILIPLAGGSSPAGMVAVVAGFSISYFGLGVANVIIVSLRQSVTPLWLMGRMTSVFRTLLFGGGAIGGLVAGALSAGLGSHAGLLVVATASLLVVPILPFTPAARLAAYPAVEEVTVDEVAARR
ncbi:MFS transporter [Actinocatenispora sera]|uniref:MFS transporter n=1 Tax=Actinocatenispora sera TaxID=390989 RepID=UPI0033FF6FA2